MASTSLKRCGTCATFLSADSFNKRERNSDGLDSQCRDCINKKRRELRQANPAILEQERRWRAANPDKWREYQRRDQERNAKQRRYDAKRRATPEQRAERSARRRDGLYGLEPGQYDRMVESQGGLCAMCFERPEKLVVDHCHDTGRVRELLCNKCNTAFGLFAEDIERLTRAIEYARRHKEVEHG